MTNVIQFKRRTSGAAGAPSGLKSGEPAYNGVDKVLYVGHGDDGSGNATSVEAVGGSGAAVMIAGSQTITGDKTFSGAIGLPRQTTVAGVSVPSRSNRRHDVLATTFSTTSGTDVEAWLGTELARVFPSGVAASLDVDLRACLQATRATSSAGAMMTLQWRQKNSGVWGAWSDIETDRLFFLQATGASYINAVGEAFVSAALTLNSTTTHYQFRVLLRVYATGSTPTAYLRANSRITIVEQAQ